MIKTLLKKELIRTVSGIVIDKRKGEKRSALGIVLYALLFVLLAVSLGFAFGAYGFALSEATLPGREWLYMALSGCLGLMIGLIGSVFSTYATLYKAKDNDLLLSMPIEPSAILISKLLSVFSTSLIFCAVGMIPCFVVYWISDVKITALSVIFSLLSVVLMALLSAALSCVLGWLVAVVVGLFPNKNVTTIIASVTFVGAYYFFYFRINSILQQMMLMMDEIEEGISGYIYPLYKMGLGATGDIASFLIFAAICLAVTAAVVFVLSRTFIKIATRTEKQRHIAYKEKTVRAVGAENALLRKELRHLFGNPAYLLNCAMGTLMMLLSGVVLAVYAGSIREVLYLLKEEGLDLSSYYSIAISAAVCFLAGTNNLTAASISLEAKSFWLTKTLPVDTYKIFESKQKLHIIMTAIPALVLIIEAGFIMRISAESMVYAIVLVLLFVFFMASAGLALNLRFPNLNWSNETEAVKRGASVSLSLFGGWVLILVVGFFYYLCSDFLTPSRFQQLAILLFIVLTVLLNSWLRKGGVKKFEELL